MRFKGRYGAWLVALAMVFAALVLPAASPEPVRAAGTITGAYFDSELGEGIGEGRQVVYDASNSSFNLLQGTDNWLNIGLSTADTFGNWNLVFAPASGGHLVVGTYENAVGGASPMLSVSHGGLIGCSGFGGSFTIHEYAYDPGGFVTALSISFRQICLPGGKSLFGELRFNAANGFRAATLTPASSDFDTTMVGDTGSERAFTLTNSGKLPLAVASVSITGPAAPDYGVTDDCAAGTLSPGESCTVSVTFTPATDGTRRATLTVVDDTARGGRTSALTGVARLYAWGTTSTAGAGNTWNWGHALARTTPSSGAPYLHALATTDRVGGKWARDSGPHVGVTYIRSTDNGSTWTAPRRLNAGSQHGDREAIASSGSYVYATWVGLKRWTHYRGTDPRVLYVRVSADNGATWKPIKRLTSTSGRVDISSVAASGASVYVLYTNSANGAVRLAISRNHGATWHTSTVGSTSIKTPDGRIGIGTVAASGSRVGVTWLTSGWSVMARVSTTSGRTWQPIVKLGGQSHSPTVAAAGSRIVFAMTRDRDLWVRTWDGGWGANVRVDAGDDMAGQVPYSVTLVLNGTGRIGLAWVGCVAVCEDTYTPATRTSLFWRTSRDGGATWEPRETLVTGDQSAAHRINDTPSIDWSVTAAPVVLFNGWSPGTSGYRLYTVTAS